MRQHIARCRVDPVLAPDQFSVARPLQPEDLDRRVMRQGVYPSLPAPNDIPWSEFVRSHGNKPQSVSSSPSRKSYSHTLIMYIPNLVAH